MVLFTRYHHYTYDFVCDNCKNYYPDDEEETNHQDILNIICEDCNIEIFLCAQCLTNEDLTYLDTHTNTTYYIFNCDDTILIIDNNILVN